MVVKAQGGISLEIGDKIVTTKKTGKYIGEITQVFPDHYVFKVLAVLKHPAQGDLHHPNEGDVSFFHERKALAFGEQANIPRKTAKPYNGEIPDYDASLKTAVCELMEKLEKEDTLYSRKSIAALKSLMKEYGISPVG